MQNPSTLLEQYNVTWDTPSRDSSGSMPLGNGDIGVNVWVEQDGDLLFYISKTDAWSEHARLLKLGRVRIHLTPNPFQTGQPFLQTLQIAEGTIEIRAGNPSITLSLWIDANHPVIHLEAHGQPAFDISVSLELWRTEARSITGQELHSAYGLHASPHSVTETPDTVLTDSRNHLTWFHRNTGSIWPETMHLQGLDDILPPSADPLFQRTSGGLIKGDGFIKDNTHNVQTLHAARPTTDHHLAIYLLTAQTDTPQQWLDQLEQSIASIEAISLETARDAHRDWWHAFWDRSWLFISGSPEAEIVTRGAILQRFINACAGRGAFPIKFNGSIFTVDNVEPGEMYDADYRRWGGPYWFQNTRLPYWTMLASGDFEQLLPLFKMYLDALPLARERTLRYFQHEGAFFPETMYFWGTYTNSDYGWDRTQQQIATVLNPYIAYYYQGGLELLFLMLDYYAYTQDEAFATHTLLPLAQAIIEFYAHHYPRDERGLLYLHPAQALEMWHKAINPLPDIAGLTAVLPRLLALPPQIGDEAQRTLWQDLYSVLPPLPTREQDGRIELLPAQEVFGPTMNTENPELYAIFPYRLYAVGKPDLQIGQEAFVRRSIKGMLGWRQDAIQAAYVGLTEEARADVVKNFSNHHQHSRFPAFWGPNFDWVPDQDHGNAALIALYAMLIQTTDGIVRLLPAWPREWSVSFKVHAPGGAVIEGEYQDGQMKELHTIPAEQVIELTEFS